MKPAVSNNSPPYRKNTGEIVYSPGIFQSSSNWPKLLGEFRPVWRVNPDIKAEKMTFLVSFAPLTWRVAEDTRFSQRRIFDDRGTKPLTLTWLNIFVLPDSVALFRWDRLSWWPAVNTIKAWKVT